MEKAEKRKADELKSKLPKKLIYKGNRLSLFIQPYEDPDKHIHSYEVVDHLHASVMIAHNEQNKIYFIKQWRRAVQTILLELPAGTIDPGESPEICAHRELQEEIGYRANSLSLLSVIYPSPGFCSQKLWIFEAKELTRSVKKAEDTEHLDILCYSLEEAFRFIDEGIIQDSKTICALFLWARKNHYFR